MGFSIHSLAHGVGDCVLVSQDEKLRQHVEGRLVVRLGVAEDGGNDAGDVRAG